MMTLLFVLSAVLMNPSNTASAESAFSTPFPSAALTAASPSSISAIEAWSDLDKVELKVDGIGCPYCSAGFIKAMKKLGKVQNVETDFEKGTFSFDIPKTDRLSIDMLKKATADAGYTLTQARITRADGTVDVLS